MITESEGVLRAPLPPIAEGKKRYNVVFYLDTFSFCGGNAGGMTWIDLTPAEHDSVAQAMDEANKTSNPMGYLEDHLPAELYKELEEHVEQEQYMEGFLHYNLCDIFDDELPDDYEDMTLDELMSKAISSGYYTPWESDESVVEIKLGDEMEESH